MSMRITRILFHVSFLAACCGIMSASYATFLFLYLRVDLLRGIFSDMPPPPMSNTQLAAWLAGGLIVGGTGTICAFQLRKMIDATP